jgi:hypothetical protein
MIKIFPLLASLLILASCSSGGISLVINTPLVSPSPLPAILSPTPRFIPSATPLITTLTPSSTLSPSISFTPTEIFTPTSSLTFTPTFTATPTATLTATLTPTVTPTQKPGLSVDVLGCNTSVDILHQMGEVTNAYPAIQNSSGQELTNICATLSATDEARVHPDKTACVAALSTGYQITVKLTVDTGLGQDTAIKVVVMTSEGLSASIERASCRDIGLPGWVPEKVGTIEPIP